MLITSCQSSFDHIKIRRQIYHAGADGCVIHLVERKPTVPGSQGLCDIVYNKF